MTQKIENTKINAAIDMLIESEVDLSNALGKDGLIKQLSKRILEKALQAEMDEHLGYIVATIDQSFKTHVMENLRKILLPIMG